MAAAEDAAGEVEEDVEVVSDPFDMSISRFTDC